MHKIMKQKWIYMITVLCLCVTLFSGFSPVVKAASEDVAVIFTNDIHEGVDQNIGYAGLAAYKKELETQYDNHVITVDCGDHLQGSDLGLMSLGRDITEIMNAVGFDYATFGNHEFDYKIPKLTEAVTNFNGQYLCCNIRYTGQQRNPFENIQPYVIRECNGIKIAFIGVATPNTIKSTTPSFYKEDGKIVYDFYAGNNGEDLYRVVQDNVDACREKGADFVVLLSHLGVSDTDAPYRSTDLIANTSGVDVVLDGHSHTITNEMMNNQEGQAVYLAQTGTGLKNVGKLVLNKEAEPQVTVELISEYLPKDQGIADEIKNRQSQYDEILSQEIGYTAEPLSINDPNGIRVVRNRECGMGNLVADAYRVRIGADIGIVNGGGVRTSLDAGVLKVNNALQVNPFVNYLCKVRLKGKDLLDALEYYYKDVQTEYVKDGKAFGEFGGFAQISGLKLKVDTAVPPTILLDSEGNFAGVGENRRVRDVQVLLNGQYEPLDPDKTYTVASIEYILLNGGDGMGDYLTDRIEEVVYKENDHLTYQDLSDYIKEDLKGDLSAYTKTEDRIVVTQHICAECAERINEKKATEKETGYSGDLQCRYCHTILEKGHIIPVIKKDTGNAENVNTGMNSEDDRAVYMYVVFAAITLSAVLLISRRKND